MLEDLNEDAPVFRRRPTTDRFREGGDYLDFFAMQANRRRLSMNIRSVSEKACHYRSYLVINCCILFPPP